MVRNEVTAISTVKANMTDVFADGRIVGYEVKELMVSAAVLIVLADTQDTTPEDEGLA